MRGAVRDMVLWSLSRRHDVQQRLQKAWISALLDCRSHGEAL
jgi:hypothetical protein